jgi:membrane peptidoglycan carboxypeptidase
MGQEVSATPVQMVSAVSAIANGGLLYRSRVVHEIRGDAPAALRTHPAPTQATDPKTAATVREMMENVIQNGTGKPAKLDGYTAAGKSGTAQKIDPATGHYSKNQYVASFVGFAPVNEPVLTILVVLDSPIGSHFGGDVGGPVFKRIAEQTLAYLDVPHDIPIPSDIETAKNLRRDSHQSKGASNGPDSKSDANESSFQAVAKQDASQQSARTVAFDENESVVVPSLAGQSVRGVTEECSRLGLLPSLIGNGVALEQSPEAGTQVLRGSRVTVRFGRAGDFTPAASRVSEK